jgi:hypothetical protein
VHNFGFAVFRHISQDGGSGPKMFVQGLGLRQVFKECRDVLLVGVVKDDVDGVSLS